MNFIGLIWLASYVSSFFSSHNLLKTPDYIIRLFSNKTQAVHPSSELHLAVSAPLTPDFRQVTRVSSLPLHQSSRTQIPLIQSFLQPFSWLPFSEKTVLRFDWTRSLPSGSLHAFSQGSTGSGQNSMPLITSALTSPQLTHSLLTNSLLTNPLLTTLANIAPWANLSSGEFTFRNKEGSGQITRLVVSLSRWSQKVGQAMPLVPTIAVTPANRDATSTSKSQVGTPTQRSVTQKCLPPARGFNAGESFQVRVQGQVVAELPSQGQANAFARRLKQILRDPEFNPASLKPAIAENNYLLKAGDDVLLTIDSQLARSLRRTGDLIAMDWVNNLRTALDVPTLSLTESQIQMHSLVETGQTLSGTASWYGPYFHGRLTANGENFDQNELTAAHPSLPFDTYLKVTNLRNGNTVVVRVNDRGPYVGERSLDLSRIAARCLGSEEAGVVPYEALVMEPGTLPATPQPAPTTNGAIARQP